MKKEMNIALQLITENADKELNDCLSGIIDYLQFKIGQIQKSREISADHAVDEFDSLAQYVSDGLKMLTTLNAKAKALNEALKMVEK